jgi:hypothetical protein
MWCLPNFEAILTHCDTLNYPCAHKKVIAAFDDEKSGFPF